MHTKWKKCFNLNDYNEFSILRTRLKSAIANDYNDYLESTENNINRDVKYFWTYISNKQRNSRIPSSMTFRGNELKNDTDICNGFNNYFASVLEPSTAVNNPVYTRRGLQSQCPDTISLLGITEDLIYKKLCALNINKGAGADGIPPIFARECATELTKPLHILFNKSLQLGTFPDAWKQALITPIHKSGDKCNVSNYRPVAVLPVFSKIFESIVSDFISSSSSILIIPEQHGFLRARSVVTNLVPFAQYLHDQMDVSGQVDTVYTDFSKAFDKINHDILLDKLQTLGIHGNLLRWLKSYISKRLQAVVVNSVRSDWAHVSSGVAQGSNLGPLLFLLFINDINSCFSHCKFALYADDLKIYSKINTDNDCRLLQKDLNTFYNYCSENKLYLNLDKCLQISFTRRKNPIFCRYTINDVPLNSVNSVRDLGVCFDSKLKFDIHVDTICKKAYRLLGFIIRTCKPFKNKSSVITLYKTLICSTLEYGSQVWNPQYHVYINRIESIQRRFIRYLRFKFQNINENYSLALQQLQLLSLEDRRVAIDTVSLFKIVNNMLDSGQLVQYLSFHVPQINSRYPLTFYTTTQNSNIGKHSPLYRMMSVYDLRFKDCDIFFLSLSQFKTHLYRSLFAPRLT